MGVWASVFRGAEIVGVVLTEGGEIWRLANRFVVLKTGELALALALALALGIAGAKEDMALGVVEGTTSGQTVSGE